MPLANGIDNKVSVPGLADERVTILSGLRGSEAGLDGSRTLFYFPRVALTEMIAQRDSGKKVDNFFHFLIIKVIHRHSART